MASGYIFVCPIDTPSWGVDSFERPYCKSSSDLSNWDIYTTEQFFTEFSSSATSTVTSTGLAAEDYETLWAACVLFLMLGVGIKLLKSIFTPNRG